MVNTRRHDHQIVFVEFDPDPVVAFTTDVKIASSVQNVPDLLVLV